MKLALQKLREQGHFLAIATSRSYAMAKDTMEKLGFYDMVSDGVNGITIHDQLLGIEPLDYKQIYKVYIACLASEDKS